jgi:hypothetical protein
MSSKLLVDQYAPAEEAVTAYDQRQLALYAAILDADASGLDWKEAASTLMGLDTRQAGAEACWRSHLERARWIVGEGLASALEAFGSRPTQLAH